MPDNSNDVCCKGCQQKFPSRNKMFQHLKETDGACLGPEDYTDFCKYVRTTDEEKVVILYGYLSVSGIIRNGYDAARTLVKAMKQWERQRMNNGSNTSATAVDDKDNGNDNIESVKFHRSYGHDQRGVETVKQDEETGAITEVLSLKLQTIKNVTVDQWLDQVQSILDQQLSFLGHHPTPIRILGRQPMKFGKFNAEMDVSHRRVEYLLPVDFLSWPLLLEKSNNMTLHKQLESLPSFSENQNHALPKQGEEANIIVSEERNLLQKDSEVRQYLYQLKKIMQMLATPIVKLDVNDKSAVLEKGFSLQKRKQQQASKNSNRKKKTRQESAKKRGINDEIIEETISNTLDKEGAQNRLKRKRFHNFTATMMAHEYLAFRRLDRVYHRSCFYPSPAGSSSEKKKPFLVLSLTGDLFLTGQVLRVVGLVVALVNGLVDTEFVDCVFDEAYPHLIPTPPVLPIGMMAGEASYMTWEGKAKAILSARSTDRFENGWNNKSTLQRVKNWQDASYEAIAARWLGAGYDESGGRLLLEKQWTEQVLLPWAQGANEHLRAYRLWKQQSTLEDNAGADVTVASIVPPLSTVDSTVPELFQKVLYNLRKIDKSGQWPSTTLKRQLVMVSSTKADNNGATRNSADSLSMAHRKAKSNKETRSSAYSFTEGQGGASGSFSVGYMPGYNSKQPKSNFLFPELVQAAFELETKLWPSRASSTIAINRNAQFRPHTDSGAGAGQSTSLIVGFGTYSGGELMVEGEKHDIRYKAIEFNGWTQRHWTMPFFGERYSLVWFTPKGCEGMQGIDLKLSDAALDNI